MAINIWLRDATNLKYNVRGEYINNSNYIYVEVTTKVAKQELNDRVLYLLAVMVLRPKSFLNYLAVQRVFTLSQMMHHQHMIHRLHQLLGNTTGIQFAASLSSLVGGDANNNISHQPKFVIGVPAAMASSGVQTDYTSEFVDAGNHSATTAAL